MTRVEWDAMTPDARRAVVKANGMVVIDATPEQKAAYEERLKKDEAGYARLLQFRGELTKEQADEAVRQARIRRAIARRRAKLAGNGGAVGCR